MIIRYPQEKEKLALLKAGDIVEFEGVIYTARDAAHKRIQEILISLSREYVKEYSHASYEQDGKDHGQAHPDGMSDK